MIKRSLYVSISYKCKFTATIMGSCQITYQNFIIHDSLWSHDLRLMVTGMTRQLQQQSTIQRIVTIKTSMQNEMLCDWSHTQLVVLRCSHHRFYGEGVHILVDGIPKVECSECGLRLICSSLQNLIDCKVLLQKQGRRTTANLVCFYLNHSTFSLHLGTGG